MQMDPSRWLISLAGFAYDWIITREWTRALMCFLPCLVLLALGLAVALGSWGDRSKLAARYMELGDQEIESWEQVWAPAGTDSAVADTSTENTSTADTTESRPSAADSDAAQARVSPFAQSLFSRAQLLAPSDRSRFVIAATLAQRGALTQAKAMLSQAAPEKEHGYAPAHALLAQLLILELQRQPPPRSRQLAEQIVHHADAAKSWERTPRSVLLSASDLNTGLGDIPAAIRLAALSAQRYPADNFVVARLAASSDDQRLYQQARNQAQQHFEAEIAQHPHNDTARLHLADLYVMPAEIGGGADATAQSELADQLLKNLDRAEQLLEQLPEEQHSPAIRMALSNIYLKRYDMSFEIVDNRVSVNFQHLDTALRIDATNPRIAEAVAKLVRLQGPRPSDELVKHLLERLASGTATPTTHALLAELYLVRQDLAKATPHLEQVVQRYPNAPQYLNNLAFCLAELQPERREEALQLALRAVQLSQAAPSADYYDTLSHVYALLDRHVEAIAAVERAIGLSKDRPDFHLRAAAEYRLLNNPSLASLYEANAQRLQSPPDQAQEPAHTETEVAAPQLPAGAD